MFDADGPELNNAGMTRTLKAAEQVIEFDMPGEEEASHPLDTEEVTRLHSRLMGYFQNEVDIQSQNRFEMAEDEDFYDGIQISEEDMQILKDRGQDVITYNVLAQSINWIIGSEKRARTDFKVLPRTKEDAVSADLKTSLLKYLSDCNRTVFHRSRAFEDAVKAGIGWLEDGVADGGDGEEPIYSRYESWRNIVADSSSTEMDCSDGRYIFRNKWVDLDIAIALFPEREDMLRRSAVESGSMAGDMDGDEIMDYRENHNEAMAMSTHDNTGSHRDRVRLIEAWYRKPERVSRFVDGAMAGEAVDPNNPQHASELQAGHSATAERLAMTMHCAIMTAVGMCHMEKSPYRHNKFPFTPVWGYRRGRDGAPYGAVRGLKGMQKDINKRAAKSLFIMSTNKTIMDKGAVDDMSVFLEEVARPDGVIEKNPGKALEINVDRELSPAHMDQMSRSIGLVQSVSGVTDEQMGRTTNAKSGVAIQARQEQGGMSTSKLFDNMRFAVQVQGEKQLSLGEQYTTDTKQFRITNQRGSADHVTVNDGLPENDITRSKADFVISDVAWNATIRQAQSEQLMDAISKLPPEIGIRLLDLAVESMDLPNRDELVKRIREVNGMKDPDGGEPTPEEQQALDQAAQAQQAQQQLQQAMAEAQLRKLNSDAAKNEAAAQAQAQESLSKMANQGVATQAAAIAAAQAAMTSPALLPVADTILHEAGFVGATDIQQAQMQAQAEQAQQQAMQEQMAQEQAMQQQMQQEQMQQPTAAQSMQGGIPQQATEALPQ
jgi:hypothetical protein